MKIDIDFYEKAILFLQGKPNVSLTDKENVKLEKCRQIAFWTRKYGLDEAIQMSQKEFKISERQALRYQRDSIKIYGSANVLDKDFLIATTFNDIRQTRKLALDTEDVRSLVQCDRNSLSLIKDHFGDVDTPDFDKIQPPTVLIQYNPALVLGDKLEEENLEQELAILSRPKRKKEIYEDAKIVEKDE